MPNQKEKKDIDGIEPKGSLPEKEEQETEAPKPSDSSLKLKVIDNKIPHRGVLWYVVFTAIFLGASGFTIYFQDWALLFFVVVFGGVTLWRGHTGKTISIEIDSEGIKINERRFFYEQIESWYFSRIGDDFTVTFQMAKKYLPRLTYIFTESKYLEQIRKKLGGKVPETEPREESIIDFAIRKLKI